jgi:hypothetical protein
MTHNPHLNVVPVEDLMVMHRSSSSTSMRKRKIDGGMLSDEDHDVDDGCDDDDFIASAYANNVDNHGDEEEAHSSWSRAMEIADAAILDVTAADGDDECNDKVVDAHDDDDGVHDDDDDDDDGQSMTHACLYHHSLTGVLASLEDRVSGVHYTVYGTTKVHATNLLQLLEASVGSSVVFIDHYSLIQRRIENSKNKKRRKLAAEAIIEPKVYAERKVIDFTYCIHERN